MCQVLIWDTDPNSSDPKFAHSKGDVFCVRDDDFVFGAEECPPKFKIVKIKDKNKGLFKKYVGAWLNADSTPYRMSLWRYDEVKESFIRKSDGLEEKTKDK